MIFECSNASFVSADRKSNVITFVQQYVLMRHYKVETPFDRWFARMSGKKAAT